MAERRTDAGWVAAAWDDPASRVLLVSRSGRAPVEPAGPALRFVTPAEASAVDGVRVWLGGSGGVRYLALLADDEIAPETGAAAGVAGGSAGPAGGSAGPAGGSAGPAGESAGPAGGALEAEAPLGAALAGLDWRGLRELATELTDLDVGLLTAAVALQAWHRTHRHCPRCGTVTEVTKAGWTRTCPADGSEHFPRTDPAVIMLVHDGAGRCVLARGPQWPPGRMSVLAGFVEAGESAEAAVAREVREEVGIEVRDVTYVASQPHPFPSSLMLGYTARVAGDPRLVIDADEIVEAGWYTRERVRRTADWGSEAGPADGDSDIGVVLPELRGLPGAMSIARQLINAWLLSTD
ncbi:MAG: NAD(+) diphosphatase [Actinobacteria bacterium]|nr:NAD(+) diphosphatase [Actinomycetota bacterium]